MIELKNISKTFKIAKRDKGIKASIRSLWRRGYHQVKALKDVSFKIQEGEIVGYIGPNGAGKSSTIKIMSGILTPDAGECLINGKAPWLNRKEYVKNIGVVFGQRSQLWWDIPVIDSFELIKDIYGVSDAIYSKNLMELGESLDILDLLRVPTRQLSLGQRMRCEIAAALLHEPKILFLDEPTIGLDAVSKIAVREFITKINKEKKTTIILTTHDMQDIEVLTNRVILIGKGEILFDGPLNDLKQRFQEKRVLSIDYIGDEVEVMNGMTILNSYKQHAEIGIDTEKITISDAISYLGKQVDIQDVTMEKESIESIIVSLYKEFGI